MSKFEPGSTKRIALFFLRCTTYLQVSLEAVCLSPKSLHRVSSSPYKPQLSPPNTPTFFSARGTNPSGVPPFPFERKTYPLQRKTQHRRTAARHPAC